ncbi:hypothetical protein SNE40_004482 [Patella caerulea]
MLQSTAKIDKVAVFNSNGAPIAVTEDMTISKLEGQALLNSLYDPSRSIAKIHIDNTDYTCFQGNDNTLLGNNKSKKKTFIAHVTNECLILVLGNSEGHGSFLFELKQNLFQLQKRNEQEPRRRSRQSQDGTHNNANRHDRRNRSDLPSDIQQTLETSTLPSMPVQQTVSDNDVLVDLNDDDEEEGTDNEGYDDDDQQQLHDIVLY